ncbi:MAG: hypothetical protein KF819_19385 [Labilithrix sp.]|nr:hypothetical protein [Labilithrix sp.]
MTSARQLRDELVQLTRADPKGARRQISMEVVVESLFYRLLNHPEELEAFEALTWLAYEKQHQLRALAPGYTHRNVALTWDAAHRTWQWPPNHYATYDAMVADGLPGIHVVGECWGMSKITHPKRGGGLLLSGDPASVLGPRVRWSTPGRKHVRCLLGATWGEVNDFLDLSKTRNLENQPGFEGLTVAGNLGTGGHGSGLGLGPLSSMARQIVLGPVTPGGEPVTFDRQHADFDYVATHLGRLGPVVEIDLDLREVYNIAEERQIRVLGRNGTWQEDLHALVAEAVALQAQPDVHSAEIWIAPYVDDGELVTAFGVRRRTTDPISTDTKRPSVLRCEALQALGRFVAIIVASLQPKWIRPVLRQTVKATKTPRVVMSARHGLDFGAPNVNRMGAIEMAMDISKRADGTPIITVIDKLAELARKKDRYVFAPMGVRFVGAGPDRGLSPHVGRKKTMHIEIPTFGDDETFHGDEVLAPLQRALAKLDGRPHWGQRIYLSTAELSRLWPASEIAGMKRVVQRLDPHNVFANVLVDPVLGIS